MLYLVTGGAGFIGSRLVKKLIEYEHSVIVIDNLSTGTNVIKDGNIEFIEGDITNENIFKNLKKVDGIFHLAAMSKVLPSLTEPNMIEFCTMQNVFGTINVLKYAVSFDKPIKVIYSASSTYYGLNNIPNIETQLPDCQSPYALTKYIGELYCDMFYKLYNLPNVRLRYFMVFGPGQPFEGQYAVVTGIFIDRCKNNKSLLIHGDGTQTRDFVHVDDVVQANILAMESSLVNDTINVGTGKMTSIKEIADLISQDQIHIESRKNDLKNTLSDCDKIQRLLKWKPTKSIQNSLYEGISDDSSS